MGFPFWLLLAGDKWQMYIPSELGYGDAGTGPKIKGGDVLVFNMEKLGVEKRKGKGIVWNWLGLGEEAQVLRRGWGEEEVWEDLKE